MLFEQDVMLTISAQYTHIVHYATLITAAEAIVSCTKALLTLLSPFPAGFSTDAQASVSGSYVLIRFNWQYAKQN